MNATERKIIEIAESNPEGFTISLEGYKPVKSGICVAYSATQNSHSVESLSKVIAHAKAHSGVIGGWLDPESSLYYFDSVKVFEPSQLSEALEFAIQENQIAIYDIESDTTIRL